MRLSYVLSNPPTLQFKQVEGFLGDRNLAIGKQRKINVGIVSLIYYCKNCMGLRSFSSNNDIYCIGVNENLVSIDCVLNCRCGSSVQIWFLVDCDGVISGRVPEVRVLKRSEKLSNDVLLNTERYGDLSELLEKAQRANRDEFGAGAMVYLRKIFELITKKTAEAEGIQYTDDNGRRKTFKKLLREVDSQCSIIPREFSANGYRLFGELSDIVHGEYTEDLALQKFESLQRLVIGILDNVKNNSELMEAIGSLNWNEDGGTQNE